MPNDKIRERRDALPMQTRLAEVSTVNAEARTVDVVWTTGAPVRRRNYDWDSGKYVYYDEILVVSSAAIDLSRLERGAPVLDSHSTWQTSAQLAIVERAWIEGGRGLATIRFPAAGIDENIDRFFALVMDGQRRNISVGYSVDTVRKEVDEKNGTIEKWFVERWTPFEISFVTIGADMDAQVRQRSNADGERSFPVQFISNRAEPEAQEGSMPNPVDKAAGAAAETIPPTGGQRSAADTPVGVPPAQPAPSPHVLDTAAVTEAARLAVQAEQARTTDLLALRGQFPDHAGIVDEAVRSAASVAEVKLRIFEAIRTTSEQNPIRSVVETGYGRQDETDTRRGAMSAAIVVRLAHASGERSAQIPDTARQYVGMGFAELAAECIGYRGNLRTAAQVATVLERAFHSQSDFPGIFTDAMNTRLLARYQTAMPTYRSFAARYMTGDLRPTNIVRAGDFPTLQEIKENGEIKSGTFGESKEMLQVFPYGVEFGISRAMIINDQLGAIDQVLGSAGARVADWENVKVFAVLLSNSGAGPTLLTDSKAIFHTGHNNLAGSGAVPSVTTIGAGRAAMMKQTTIDGLIANFQPKVILSGPDHATGIDQILTTITPAQAANAVPVWVRSLTPAADANISGNAWYLFADPAVAPCLHYGYLEGYEGPRLSTKESWGTQGMRVKLEHDFGVAGSDFRGGYKNPGAAPA